MESEFLITVDAAGQEFMRKFRSCVVIPLGRLSRAHAEQRVHVFLYTGSALFAVTAKHVFDGYMRCAKERKIVCQIDGIPFDPEQRLISTGSDAIDIATFRVTEEEFGDIGRATVPWPPLIPKDGNGVLVCGLPGFTRLNPRPGVVDIGYLTSLMRVDGVTDRTLSMMRQPNEEVLDILGLGIPPLVLDIGGLSGGPVATVVKDREGELSWRISGVICEGHQSYNIVKAVRADLINEDGTVNTY